MKGGEVEVATLLEKIFSRSRGKAGTQSFGPTIDSDRDWSGWVGLPLCALQEKKPSLGRHDHRRYPGWTATGGWETLYQGLDWLASTANFSPSAKSLAAYLTPRRFLLLSSLLPLQQRGRSFFRLYLFLLLKIYPKHDQQFAFGDFANGRYRGVDGEKLASPDFW